MKKKNIYFVGGNRSFVSLIFLNSLIDFSKKNPQYELKYIIDTDREYGFTQKGKIYQIKNKIKSVIYFFFNNEYYTIEKVINIEFREKKDIIYQAKINNIKYKKFSTFDQSTKKKSSILLNFGGEKIFNNSFLKKFDICINYHNAEIPKFRGTFSNCYSLFYNKFFTYFCFHYINTKIDKGYVFYKDKVKINKKIKHNLFYDFLKSKKAANKIKKILTEAIKKRKYKSLSLKKGTYYPISYYKNLFTNIEKFTYNEIQKYIDIFGGIYYMENFVTGIKKSGCGVKIKDCYIQITHIKYLPRLLYKFLNFLFFIKA